MTNEKSVSLHQQDGGMTVQAFAEQQGISLEMARYYVRTGRVIGARQDARTKKWTIYPPAKLVDKDGDTMRRREPATVVDVGTSQHGLSVNGLQPVQETREGSSNHPPAKRGFNAFERCAEVGALAPTTKQREDVHAANVYRDPETQRVLQALHEAAIRQHREGIHYLRLDAHEFAQLYAALDNDRSRVRKLVGKGVLPVGLLRCSDSVWQKMQAMSREGRLL